MRNKVEQIFKLIEEQSIKSHDVRFLNKLKPLFNALINEMEEINKRMAALELPIKITTEPVKRKRQS